jgi:hypothetical protein
VVEHAVQQDAQAAGAGRGDQLVEVLAGAQPRVDAVVVDGVVAVRLGGEHRAQRQPGAAELDRVVEPALQPAQPVDRRGAGRQRGPFGADEAQRVHLPPDRVVHPGHQ